MKKPNWNASSRIFGGELSTVGKNPVFQFPGPEKRDVCISMNSWIGLSPGAQHYYGTVREEDNYAWDGKEGAWRKPWHAGEEYSGKFFRGDFDTEEQAFRWCRCVIRENFSDETHRVRADFDIDFKMNWKKKERKPALLKKSDISVMGYYLGKK